MKLRYEIDLSQSEIEIAIADYLKKHGFTVEGQIKFEDKHFFETNKHELTATAQISHKIIEVGAND
jgi:hypothetical protein